MAYSDSVVDTDRFGRAQESQWSIYADGFAMERVLRFFFYHWRIFGTLFLVAMITVSFQHRLFPYFRTRASLNIENKSNPMQAMTARLGPMTAQEDDSRAVDRFLVRLRSFGFFLEVAQDLSKSPQFQELSQEINFANKSTWKKLAIETGLLHVKPDTELLSVEKVAETLIQWTDFTKNGSDRIFITLTAPTRGIALFLTNWIAERAVNTLVAYEIKELEDTKEYIQIELHDCEKALRAMDQQVVDFKKSSRQVSGEAVPSELNQRASAIQRDLNNVTLDWEENKKLTQTFEARHRHDSLQEQHYKFGLTQKIAELKKQGYHLQLRKDGLSKMLDNLLKSNNQQLEQRMFDLRKRIELEYSLYQELKKQEFQIEMGAISARNKVRLFEKARDRDVYRSEGLSSKLSMALIISLLASTGVALLWGWMDPPVKTKQDLSDLGLGVLGNLPELSSRIQISSGMKHRWMPLIYRFDVESRATFSFNSIRDRLSLAMFGVDAKAKVVCVLSQRFEDGGAFVVRNLAASMAYSGKRTLLMDCDLRKRHLTRILCQERKTGLTEVLQGELKFDVAVAKKVRKNLDVLGAGEGRASPTQLFGSKEFEELVHDLTAVYDTIFLHTTPLSYSREGIKVADQSDLSVMVIAQNQTSLLRLMHVVSDINRRAKFKLVAILNRTQEMENKGRDRI